MNQSTMKPHAVCIPSPAQGHIHAALKLARLLHGHGFHVTFVHTDFNYDRILASGCPSAIDSTSDSFRFETIAGGLPQSDPNTNPDIDDLMDAVTNKLAAPFRKLLSRLEDPSSSGVPPVTCVVTDAFATFPLGIAEEFGLPCAVFCPVSAASYLGFLHLEELAQRGLWPPTNEADTWIDWIHGVKSMSAKHVVGFPPMIDPNLIKFNFVKDQAQQAHRASAVIFNTFTDLEDEALNAMASFLPPLYAVGPLNLLGRQTLDEHEQKLGGSNSLWKEDDGSLRWLDGRAPGSVLYVNFGSLALVTREQLTEFAWGLANSGHDFLWGIRPDILAGDTAMLPKVFAEETTGRGFMTSWCSQEEVLMHPAVGGFLTHCGWNSMMETIGAGVPVLCWPYFGDQPTNCSYACNEWGIGLEIDKDVKREEVERVIRELMAGEKGNEMRQRALEWKESALKATSPAGGKSIMDFERVIEEVLLRRK